MLHRVSKGTGALSLRRCELSAHYANIRPDTGAAESPISGVGDWCRKRGEFIMTWSSSWRPAAWLGLPGLVSLTLLAFPAVPAGQAPVQDDKQVTFTKDIAPILQRSCQRCHRPDSIAPMSLLTYEDARPWAKAMKLRTGLRSRPEAMPPWYIEKNIGIQEFKDDYSLTDEQIANIAKWADSGAPRGNPADMPPPIKFPDSKVWTLGQPDLIVVSPSIEVKAGAPDWWGPLSPAVPTGLTEDRYVASLEMREINDLDTTSARQTIGGLHTVHHLIWSAIPPNMDGNSAAQAAAELETWPIHEVGRNADVFDPEAGRLLKAGSTLVFPSAHLHTTGVDTKARVEYGFKFHPKGYKPTKKIRGLDVTATMDIDLKPMTGGQKIEAFSTLTENRKIVIYEPHMHASGVRMCLDAIWGSSVQTLSCAGYNHGWVRNYAYADDAQPILPKGTILRVTGYFDTTPANRNVSDPRNWQGLGHRSIDNMLINLGQTVTLSDDEFWAEMAKRRERLHLAKGETVLGCPLCGYDKRPAGPPAVVGQQQ